MIACAIPHAQDSTRIRIVDSLSVAELSSRRPVLLRSEVDSMVQAGNSFRQDGSFESGKVAQSSELRFSSPVVMVVLGLLLLMILLQILLLRRQRRLQQSSTILRKQLTHVETNLPAQGTSVEGERQVRQRAALEKKIEELTRELTLQIESNKKALEDYQAIKESIAAVYKVRNYPGYETKKGDGEIVRDLLQTERSVANYAFEKFLKPVITLVDANKNSPARMSQEDTNRLFDLLLSLSLYYIEYLYLRIDELSVGGHMVERIGSHAKGNGLDPALLKKLNTDHGSRALALRLALDRKGVGALAYPVFDETNLNTD